MNRRYSKSQSYRRTKSFRGRPTGRKYPSRRMTRSYRMRRRRAITISVAVLFLILALIIIITTVKRNHNNNDFSNIPTNPIASSTVREKKTTSNNELSTEAPTSTFSNVPENVKQAFLTAGADESYAATHPYCIAVNTMLNEVIVYGRGSDGTFSLPVKAMVASCGKLDSPTKTGTFKTVEKYVWRALNGSVFGQYATRIDGPYLFHSVPYYQQDPSTLETEEYNHLGENRSLGCVRLAVADCKWIYDNCPLGTIVTLYADANVKEPLPKPTAKQIPLSGEKSGWDPTDPKSENPWNR